MDLASLVMKRINSMSNYHAERQWSDQYIPKIKKIVGPLLLSVTPDEIDCRQAADLMIFSAKNMRIAARIRRSEYIGFSNEFTVRSALDSGSETEFSKIQKGFADWMFYGILSNIYSDKFHIWHVFDLDVFRSEIDNNAYIKFGDKSNGDGTHFRWFDINSFPSAFVIAKGGASFSLQK